MKYIIAAGILGATGMAVSCAGVVSVCRALARGEDTDDLMDLAEAFGVAVGGGR